MKEGSLLKLKSGSYVCVNDKVRKTVNLYKDAFGIILQEIKNTHIDNVVIKELSNNRNFYYVYYKGMVLIATE